MSGQRLRLTTSRPAGYRRGGQVIGGAAAPTFLERNSVTPEQGLAIIRDPNIAVAIETESGGFHTLTTEERAEVEDGLLTALDLASSDTAGLGLGGLAHGSGDLSSQRTEPVSEPDTAEPQGDGLTLDAEASKAGGPDAAADASDGSAADAGTTAPAQPEAAAPAPEKPAPAKPIRSGKRKTAAV